MLSSLDRSRKSRSFLWLLLAVPLMFVAMGLWSLPAAAWLAPVFLLRFVRDQSTWRGCMIAALLLVVVSCAAWHGATGRFLQFPLPYVVGAALGLVAVLPYLIDRLLAARLSGPAATLVFPAAAVTVEFAASFGPFGTWSSAAYTQKNLALLQVTSVTGIWGVTFLLHWTASVANAVWEEGLMSPEIQWTAGLWAGLLAAMFVFGGARLAQDASSDAIPLATITGTHDASSFWDVRRQAESREAVRDSARAVQRDYLQRARRAARAGATLVSWPEAAVPVPHEDTAAFLDRARRLARKQEVYLAMGVNAFPRPDTDDQLENKVVWIGPGGTVRTEGLKTRLVPGEPGRAGTGTLPDVSAPAGTWSSVVCYDLDFPALIRQAGRQDVDLLVAPSNDWAAIAERHAHMARIRAIENGTSLLRPTSNGLTLATGPLGRTHARVNHFTSPEHLQMAHLPRRGKSTIYTALGDFFAWGCGLGLLVLTGSACFRLRLPLREAAAYSAFS
ncbi:nitrilase-related carbon-nitrogen hydrolase [Salinibacter grassmerensis]|uniref:nitrilase-related carbon-nitrogen hydrolase n=1 Tax=Salinibacter grassmerensis TaxID=3040353 RepID=UPI0021E725D4|nr:nitrilase-related carbon-nitrogen hydrolase [Salinibacter grassmerensis]